MKFSTRTTYGLRAMINLAQFYKQGSRSLSVIAKQEKISLKYLERLFSELKKAGLIKAEKGAQGGYLLDRSPDKIKISEIVEVLEGDISPFHCISSKGEITCGASCQCNATSVLVKVQYAIQNTLKSIKLSDLL